MIAFGSSIVDPEAYRRYAGAGIAQAAEPGSEVYAFATAGTISRSLNLLLAAAAARSDLEALVLVDPAVEIADPEFCPKVRRVLADPGVGVAGYAGATGFRSIAWWDGSLSCGPVVHRYHEHGGGQLPAYSWARPAAPPAEVETVDGSLLVLSPWVVRNLRFDESLHLEHGFDVDFCLRVRRAGRKVVTADFRAILHRPLELVPEPGVWVEAHIRMAEARDDRMPDGDLDWRRRARRAEAEREAARTLAYSNRLEVDARVLELERALAAATESTSWRITAPLRALNRLRRRLR